MDKGNLTLVFKNFELEHVGKDVFMVPYYLGKINNLPVKIVCPSTESNQKLGNNIHGVDIVRIPTKGKSNLNSFYYNLKLISYLVKNAKHIKLFMCIHPYTPVVFLTFIFKFLNPKGFIYNKADGGLALTSYRRRHVFTRNLHRLFIKTVNILSIESEDTFQKVLKNYPSATNKIKLITNGFDEDLLQSSNLKIRKHSEKENIIITVGRLGTYPKNIELILETIPQIDLQDWKVLLIGPIEQNEQDFQVTIDQFYNDHNSLREKVIFTGPIYDKKILWEYYNKAKVFILSSKFEGFANVYSEAYRFDNYILTTDVGGARDSISDGYGAIFNDALGLATQLQSIINEKIDLDTLDKKRTKKDISWKTLLSEIKI